MRKKRGEEETTESERSISSPPTRSETQTYGICKLLLNNSAAVFLLSIQSGAGFSSCTCISNGSDKLCTQWSDTSGDGNDFDQFMTSGLILKPPRTPMDPHGPLTDPNGQLKIGKMWSPTTHVEMYAQTGCLRQVWGMKQPIPLIFVILMLPLQIQAL